MSTARQRQAVPGRARRAPPALPAGFDVWLVAAVVVLVALGLVMVTSASITSADRQLGQPFYYLIRQAVYIGVGALAAVLVARTRLERWERAGALMLALGFALLVAVLIPGVSREVNGSVRWLPLGIVNLQVSEVVKLGVLIYLAGYLVRHGDEVRTNVAGFMKPMALLAVICGLLLAEPDFGATAVLLATALGMMFLAGMRLWHFAMLLAVASGSLVTLALTSPYRVKRLTTFRNPFEHPYDSGYQLIQALIAFGRGEWFGVGLGGSVQKLFYLPEAHTDFLFAVLAEELGLLGVVAVVALYAIIVWRAFEIGARAESVGRHFAAYLAYGIGLWIGLQALINLGVNMGVLPTKGLTLPFLSYGGSSMVVTCTAVGFLVRVGLECPRGVARARAGRAPFGFLVRSA